MTCDLAEAAQARRPEPPENADLRIPLGRRVETDPAVSGSLSAHAGADPVDSTAHAALSDEAAAHPLGSLRTIGGPRVDASAIMVAAMLRLLADIATPARAIVSAVNALLAHERQRLAGRIGLAGLLADEVRAAIIVALTRVLADETAPARTTIAAANSLLALERNRLRAERRERALREEPEVPGKSPPSPIRAAQPERDGPEVPDASPPRPGGDVTRRRDETLPGPVRSVKPQHDESPLEPIRLATMGSDGPDSATPPASIEERRGAIQKAEGEVRDAKRSASEKEPRTK
jgi:hypothetical protein